MKRWRWILGGAAALAAIAGFIVWDAHRRADAAIDAERGAFERLAAAYRRRDFRRPPSEGEGVDGNAWDLYRLHLPAMKLPPDEEAEIPEVDGTWEPGRLPDDEVLDVLYLKYAPTLQGLRDALRRRVVDPQLSYEQGSAVDLPLVGPAIMAAKVLAGGIAHHHRMGRSEESLDLAALGLALGHDQRPGVLGQLVRVVMEGILVEQVLAVLGDHRYTAAALERFAGRLDRLDAQRPLPGDAWDEEELFIFGNVAADAWAAEATGGVRALPQPGWRQLWSWKLARAQSFGRFHGYFREVRRLLALPTPARVAEAARLREEARNDDLQLPRALMPDLIKTLASDVDGLAYRTVLRAAVGLAWYEAEKGVFPESLESLIPRYLPRAPLCPYSGKSLGYRAGAVWSPGQDGVDDGGAEDPQDPRRFEKKGTDFVAHIKRHK